MDIQEQEAKRSENRINYFFFIVVTNFRDKEMILAYNSRGYSPPQQQRHSGRRMRYLVTLPTPSRSREQTSIQARLQNLRPTPQLPTSSSKDLLPKVSITFPNGATIWRAKNPESVGEYFTNSNKEIWGNREEPQLKTLTFHLFILLSIFYIRYAFLMEKKIKSV